MKFELKQLPNNIFILTFDDPYDVAMHFLRHTEFLESPNKDFKGRHFRILDYIEWYSKEHGGKFTYPQDWTGYNLPSRVFKKSSHYGKTYPFDSIPDKNKYDEFMERIVDIIWCTVGGNFYIIGHQTGYDGVVEHELAHAMYDRISDYRNKMLELMQEIDSNNCQLIRNCLKKMGYSSEGYPKDVVSDEVQAYLSTGLPNELESLFRCKRIPKKIVKPFEEVFNKHKKELLSD